VKVITKSLLRVFFKDVLSVTMVKRPEDKLHNKLGETSKESTIQATNFYNKIMKGD
jgi:hypothetical protein